jgi:hypothetical protein
MDTFFFQFHNSLIWLFPKRTPSGTEILVIILLLGRTHAIGMSASSLQEQVKDGSRHKEVA